MKTNIFTSMYKRAVDILKPFFNKRFYIVNAIILLFLLFAFIIRTVFLFSYTSLFDCNVFELFKVYAGGLLYDIIASLYFALPFTIFALFLPKRWYRSRIHRGFTYFFFTFFLLLLILSAIAEWYFWEEFQVRFNFIAVDYLIYTTEVIQNIIESYPVGIIFPVLFIGAAVITFLCRNIIRSTLNSEIPFKERIKYGIPYFALPVVFFIAVNGSWENLAENKYNNELAKDGIYCFFEAYLNNEINYDQFYITHSNTDNFGRLRKLLAEPNAVFSDRTTDDILRSFSYGKENKMNVVFVCVESLSAGYIDYFGSKEGLTPNLDTLAKKCIIGENYFATGTRTVRGIEALMLSTPPTPGASIVRRKNNDSLFSIGSVLGRRGYELKFIYGGLGYFDNMNQFFGDNGFTCIDKPSFSKEEKTFSNAWGLCDEDVFNKTLKEADASFAKGKNFFSFVLTTSNHRPYTFPAGKVDMPFNREGAVKYTDYAIGEFLKKAKEHPWFENTIFVISADHCASSAGKTDLPLNTYKIPLFIYSPKTIPPRRLTVLSSQIDVTPTVLALMNINYKSAFFGRNLLSLKKDDGRAFISNYQKIGYVKDNIIAILDVKQQKSFYTFDAKTLEMQRKNESRSLEQYLDEAVAYYQSAYYLFKNGLLKNRE